MSADQVSDQVSDTTDIPTMTYREAMREAGQWQRRATRERDAEAMQRLKEAGVHVQTLTEEAREQLRQRSLQVHAQFAERVGTDYLQRVYAAIAQLAP